MLSNHAADLYSIERAGARKHNQSDSSMRYLSPIDLSPMYSGSLYRVHHATSGSRYRALYCTPTEGNEHP